MIGTCEAQRAPLRACQKLPLPHDDIAPDDRADRPALDLYPVIWRPTAPALDPVIGQNALLRHIDDGEVGIVTFSDPALAGDAEELGRSVARELDETFERKPATI